MASPDATAAVSTSLATAPANPPPPPPGQPPQPGEDAQPQPPAAAGTVAQPNPADGVGVPKVADDDEPIPLRLFVGQLPKNLSENELKAIFEPYGAVHNSEIVRVKSTGESRGCGFVVVESKIAADKAIEALNSKKVIPPVRVNSLGLVGTSTKSLLFRCVPPSVSCSLRASLRSSSSSSSSVLSTALSIRTSSTTSSLPSELYCPA